MDYEFLFNHFCKKINKFENLDLFNLRSFHSKFLYKILYEVLIGLYNCSLDNSISITRNQESTTNEQNNLVEIKDYVLHIKNNNKICDGIIRLITVRDTFTEEIIKKRNNLAESLLDYIKFLIASPISFRKDCRDRCIYTICRSLPNGLKIPYDDCKRLFTCLTKLFNDELSTILVQPINRPLVELLFIPDNVLLLSDNYNNYPAELIRKNVNIVSIDEIEKIEKKCIVISHLLNSEPVYHYKREVLEFEGCVRLTIKSFNENFKTLQNFNTENNINSIYYISQDICIVEENPAVNSSTINYYELKSVENIDKDDYNNKKQFLIDAFNNRKIKYNEFISYGKIKNFHSHVFKPDSNSIYNIPLYKLIKLRNDIFKEADFNYPIITNEESFKISRQYENGYMCSLYKLKLSAKDLNLYKEDYKGNISSLRTLQESALIINKKSYLPVFFNTENGYALVNVYENYIFTINDDYVIPEYMTYILNTESFFNKKIINNREKKLLLPRFLNSEFPIPNDSNNIRERQKQIVNEERNVYLNSIITDLKGKIDITRRKRTNILPINAQIQYNNGTSEIKLIIESSLGGGGFSKTYKGYDVNRDKTVAIKEFFIEGMQTREGQEVEFLLTSNVENLLKAKHKFRKEANKIKMIKDSPNIVRVYDIFDSNGTSYYTMEYIDGYDLSYYCESKEDCRLSEDEALKIILEVCKAVNVMHSFRMNHLDIKPENIMIENLTKRIVLIDFGTATLVDNNHTTILNCYSDGYTPVEYMTIREFCPQKDIYSIGATLYGILYGGTPPKAEDLFRNGIMSLERPYAISDTTWHAILCAMQPDYRDRPETVNDFVSLLKTEKDS